MESLKKMASKNMGIVDINDWFNRFSFDVFFLFEISHLPKIGGAITFGRDFGALDGGEIHPWLVAFHKSVTVIRLVGLS